MIQMLARLFIPNCHDTGDEQVRTRWGMLCGCVGILLNIFLFLGKYVVGYLASSVAIQADAFNNLSDAGASLVTLLGFRLATKRADAGHPHGHGRIEYVSGFIVSLGILLVGIEVFRDSLQRILHPAEVMPDVLTFAVLIVAVAFKLYIYAYNRRYGELLNSSAMSATAFDSVGDAAATLVVLLSTVISVRTGIHIDGWAGLAVACFILWSGIIAARDTVNELVGEAPTEAFIDQICKIVSDNPEILDFHDLAVHDYGPEHRLISLHAEVSGDRDIFSLHNAIDRTERRLENELHCEAVIHMDPVAVNDVERREKLKQITEAVKILDPELTVHDFRVVEEDGKKIVEFDAVIPDHLSLPLEEIKDRLQKIVTVLWGDEWEALVRLDPGMRHASTVGR